MKRYLFLLVCFVAMATGAESQIYQKATLFGKEETRLHVTNNLSLPNSQIPPPVAKQMYPAIAIENDTIRIWSPATLSFINYLPGGEPIDTTMFILNDTGSRAGDFNITGSGKVQSLTVRNLANSSSRRTIALATADGTFANNANFYFSETDTTLYGFRAHYRGRIFKPPYIEFSKTDNTAVGSVGMHGTREMVQAINMNYANATHQYYDTAYSATWTFMASSQTVPSRLWGIQYVKGGNSNSGGSIFTNYGKVVFGISPIDNDQAKEYGSIVHAMRYRLEPLSGVPADEHIDIYNNGSVAYLEGAGMKRLQIYANGLHFGNYSAELGNGTYTFTAASDTSNNWLVSSHDALATHYNYLRFVKSLNGNYTLAAGNKIMEIEANFHTIFGARASTSVYRENEWYWRHYDAAYSDNRDKMKLTYNGHLTVLSRYGYTGTMFELYNTAAAASRFTVSTAGDVTLSGFLKLGSYPEYADNAAALAGGLTAGRVYRTGEFLKVVY